VWALTIVAAAMFLLAGTLKLIGVPIEVELFTAIGIGQWFRYVTGALEVGGAIGLIVPAFAPIAALLLAAVMIGAVITHLFVVGGSPLIAIALLAITLSIAYLRRERISSRLAIA
jgi:uncharacterized membrane protein YphA (DoxX/SURF4 family)